MPGRSAAGAWPVTPGPAEPASVAGGAADHVPHRALQLTAQPLAEHARDRSAAAAENFLRHQPSLILVVWIPFGGGARVAFGRLLLPHLALFTAVLGGHLTAVLLVSEPFQKWFLL